MLFPACVNHVAFSLRSVCAGGFIKDGAEPRKESLFGHLRIWLENSINDAYSAEIQSKEDILSRQTNQISGNIINAKESNGCFTCTVTFGCQQFEISQSLDQPNVIKIHDPASGDTELIEGICFPELQKQLLQQFLYEWHERGYVSIDLSSFDFTGMNLLGISLANTLLSRKNFDAIVAGGGSLAGAQLKTDADIKGLQLDGLELDNIMASSLITAGMVPKEVLTHYLATKPSMASHLYKTAMFKSYLDNERKAGRIPINLCAFELMDVNCKDIDFAGTQLSPANVEAIAATNGNLCGATLVKNSRAPVIHCLDRVRMDKAMAIQLVQAGADVRAVLCHYLATERALGSTPIDISGIDTAKVNFHSMDWQGVAIEGVQFAEMPGSDQGNAAIQANFEKDFLTLLRFFSKIVATLIKYSYSRDRVILEQIKQMNTASPGESEQYHLRHRYQCIPPGESAHYSIRQRYDHHGVVLFDNRQYIWWDTKRIDATIRTATGNCGEMALVFHRMFLTYSQDVLNRLGYPHVSIKASLDRALDGDHQINKVEYTFGGVTRDYLVDSWQNGQAWTYKEGMEYFRNREPDIFMPNPSKVEFVNNGNFEFANGEKYRNNIPEIFKKFGVPEQIDATIRKHKLDFVGFPAF